MSTIVVGPYTFTQTSDAEYRAWLTHVKAVLDGANPTMFTQTADTGQINLATVVRPTANTKPDYFIYKFDDGLGFAPLYIKFSFGVGSTQAIPNNSFTVGTGTDGAGNLTGTIVTPTLTSNTSPVSSASSSYGCVKAGQVAITLLAMGISGSWPVMGCLISRFTDAAGNPTNDGVNIFGEVGSGQFWGMSWVFNPIWTVTTTSIGTMYTNPFSVGSMTYNGVVQPGPVFYRGPHAKIFANLAHVIKTDVPVGAEFQVAMVGSTKRNFKNTGLLTTGDDVLAVVWE